MIRKRLADHDDDAGAGRARQRDIDAAVRQVIGGAVDADEVIDLFAVAGLEEAHLDILSDEFLGRVAALEQKNLALETLRKLLSDQIRSTERTNLVQSKKPATCRTKNPPQRRWRPCGLFCKSERLAIAGNGWQAA